MCGKRIWRMITIVSLILITLVLVTEVFAKSLSSESTKPAVDLYQSLNLSSDSLQSGSQFLSKDSISRQSIKILAPETEHLNDETISDSTKNESGTGNIIINKEADQTDAASFEFYGDLGEFSLLTSESATFSDLEAGSYLVNEMPQNGWYLDRIECDSENIATTYDGVTIDIQNSETISCTFFNHLQPPISKNVQLVNQLGGRSFAVTLQGDYAYLGEGPRLAVLDISDPDNPTRIGRTNVLPDVVQDIVVSGDFAYVAAGGSGLRVIDISDPYVPAEITFLDTPGFASGLGLSENHVILADHWAGLRIIDISNPLNPKQVGLFSRRGDNHYAKSVTVVEDLAYVASGDYQFYVFDISNPGEPFIIGSYYAYGEVRDVAVAENYAYLAKARYLDVLDISDPTNPNRVAQRDTWGHALNVAVANQLAYVATEGAGLRIFDVGDPKTPDEVGDYDPQGWVHAVAVSGEHAYVTDMSDGLHILDASNPAEPIATGHYEILPAATVVVDIAGDCAVMSASGGWQAVDIENPTAATAKGIPVDMHGIRDIRTAGDLAYVPQGDGLSIYSILDPAVPSLVGTIETPGEALDVALNGNMANLADGTHGGLRIVDVTNPSDPTDMGHYDTGGWTTGVATAGNYAYVVGWYDGLSIIDISNPESPSQVGHLNSLTWSYDVEIGGEYAYVVDSYSGLQTINVTDPESPEESGSVDLPGQSFDLALNGNTVFVANGKSGLYVIDVSTNASPLEVGFYNTPGEARDVALAGDYIFVADYDAGLIILRYFDEVDLGTIRITKATDPTVADSFTFAGDLGSFLLSGGDTEEFAGLMPGAYTISEVELSGWTVEDIVCDGENVTVIDTSVTIELGLSEVISCTFHNRRQTVTADAGGPYTGDEGAAVALDASATSQQKLVAEYQWDCTGDGSIDLSSESPTGDSCIYADDGEYTLTLTTVDIFGQSSTNTATVSIENVAPQVDAGIEQTVITNQEVDFAGSFTDPGTADTHVIEWDFGDGNKTGGTLTPQHAYTSTGHYTVTLTVIDDDGGTGLGDVGVDVVNGPPTMDNVTVSPRIIDEGQNFILSGLLSDPEQGGMSLLIDWGDGQTDTIEFSPVSTCFSIRHTCPDDPPGTAEGETYAINLTLSDAQGTFSTATAEIAVENVAPAIDAGSDKRVVVGQSTAFSAAISDAGAMDTHTVTWDFGDGSLPVAAAETMHVFSKPGPYVATATVADDDGGIGTDSLAVEVSAFYTMQIPVIMH